MKTEYKIMLVEGNPDKYSVCISLDNYYKENRFDAISNKSCSDAIEWATSKSIPILEGPPHERIVYPSVKQTKTIYWNPKND
jgi:hypothetical protein